LTLKHTGDQPGHSPGFSLLSSKNDDWKWRAMSHKNERVELEMKIMRFRQLERRTTDEKVQKGIREQIAELEQKLREIDE
jgi:hypothetical protein